ncbi:MAG: hypothetical protein ACXV3D_08765 [Halobacteriota archaeon]
MLTNIRSRPMNPMAIDPGIVKNEYRVARRAQYRLNRSLRWLDGPFHRPNVHRE